MTIASGLLRSARNDRRGNTVLEMLVALFILMVGLMAVIGLSFRNVTLGRESLKELQAANFAREGIEIVRNIRDSNKYKTGFTQGDTIWDGLKDKGGRDNAINNSAFDLGSGTFDLDALTVSNGTLLQRSDKFFIQGSTPSGSIATVFQRKVHLYAICLNDVFERSLPGRTSNAQCALTTGTEKLIGIEVVAEVSWKETTQQRSITIEERLYNW